MRRKGKHLIFVDRFFPSSELCSKCGWKNHTLTLEQRTWRCDQCGTIHDRDLNAAKNLKREGKLLLKIHGITIISTVGTTGIHACGDHTRLSSESSGR